MTIRKRFSIRSLLIAVTLVCIWLGWRYTSQRIGQREVCRELVSAALKSEHIKNAVEAENSATLHIIDQFDFERAHVADFLKPDGSLKRGGAADKFERDLLANLSTITPAKSTPTKADEFFEVQGLSSYRFYQPIWSTKECSVCHPGGKLVAVAKIEVQK